MPIYFVPCQKVAPEDMPKCYLSNWRMVLEVPTAGRQTSPTELPVPTSLATRPHSGATIFPFSVCSRCVLRVYPLTIPKIPKNTKKHTVRWYIFG